MEILLWHLFILTLVFQVGAITYLGFAIAVDPGSLASFNSSLVDILLSDALDNLYDIDSAVASLPYVGNSLSFSMSLLLSVFLSYNIIHSSHYKEPLSTCASCTGR